MNRRTYFTDLTDGQWERLRDELLERELFSGVVEAQVLAETWRRHYNEHRPHSGLDYQTPAAFAAQYTSRIKEQPAPILT